MITEYYKNYIAIIEEGSISAAARKCLIAQPALSNQLKVLEEKYGAQLLIRGARKVELTPAGKILYEKAKLICQLEDQAEREVENQEAGTGGSLKIALPPTNNFCFLQRLLESFMKQYPDVQIECYELSTAKVLEYVVNGIADVGFVRAPVQLPEEIEYHPVKAETLQLILHDTHPLSKKDQITFKDMDQQEVVISRSWQSTVEKLEKENSIRLKIAATTTSRQVAIHIARIRKCMALVPSGVGDEFPVDMVCRNLSNLDFQVHRGFILKEGWKTSKLLEHLLDCME